MSFCCRPSNASAKQKSMVKMEKKVSRFSPIALLLATVLAIAFLLSSTLASATLTASDGVSSGCTWVITQGQPTTTKVCDTTCTTTSVQQASSQLVSEGHYEACQQTSTTSAYLDVYSPPCYYDEFFSEQICPPDVYTWIDEKTVTSTGSCWVGPLYKTCQPTNCHLDTVLGDSTSKLQCPAVAPAPAPTPSPVANPTATPTPQTCTPGQEVSRSCSGNCKQATAKICNSLGTGTYDSTVTDESCTTGCTVTIPSSVTPTPTPATAPIPQKTTPPTCNIVCSGNMAIGWHLTANACVKDTETDCAAQGKVCQQNVGCVAPTAKQDCTGQGCPSGYYCYYGSDV